MGKRYPLVYVEKMGGKVIFQGKSRTLSSYRVHTAGTKSSGRAVSPWYNSKAAAIRAAKGLSHRTGRRYVILKPVAVVRKLGRKE